MFENGQVNKKMNTLLTDQPGRLFAIIVFAPCLIYKGVVYNDTVLLVLGFLLLVWDLYWLIFKEPIALNQKH